MKIPTNKITTTGISMLLLAYATVMFILYSGCRNGKITNTADTPLPDTGQVVTHVDTVPSPTSGNNGTAAYKRPGNISLLPADDSVVDDYNVRKQILEFKSPKTLGVIKTIDLVKENPFHKMGLKRRKEPYPAVYYFLMPEGKDTKQALKKFLPQEVYQEIPRDFEMDRAISKIFVSVTAGKYVTVSYDLDWLPDAYSDQGEWDGPGYGVHHVVVYDSLGNKIYTRQFDGTSQMPSVSEDGKYLFTMACLSPEWDENIRYRFTVVNIQTNKVVYEELIENCKKHGGGGDFFYYSNLNRSSYFIKKADKTSKSYLYFENEFFIQKEYQTIYNWFLLPNRQIQLVLLDGSDKIINFNTFFTIKKLD